MTDPVMCMHLVDGVIVFGRSLGPIGKMVTIKDPLVLSKYFDVTGEIKLMLSRYDNFGTSTGTTTFFETGIVSMYEVDERTTTFYDKYVAQYSILETDPDAKIEDMDWPTDEPEVPKMKETMSSMSGSAKAIDIEKLRKETIRMVWDAAKDGKDD